MNIVTVVHAHDPLLTAFLLRKGVPPLLPTNVTAPLAQLSNLLLQQGGPYIQPSNTNPSPKISALILQRYMLPLQPSAVRYVSPLISVLLQGHGVLPPAPSDVCAHAHLLSASLTQRVKIPIQPSALNNLPFPQILALPLSMRTGLYHISDLPLQQGVPPLQPLAVRDTPPLSFLLQGTGFTPILPSAVCAYVSMLW